MDVADQICIIITNHCSQPLWLVNKLQSSYKDKVMSSIIDDFVFIRQDSTKHWDSNQNELLAVNISKAMKYRDETFLVLRNIHQIQAIKKIEVQSSQYLIRFSASRSSSATRISAILLSGSVYYHSNSQHVDILLMKQLAKRQRECRSQASFCIHLGRVILVLNNLLILPTNRPHQQAQIYLQLISKNLIHFSRIQQKYLKIGKKVRSDQATGSETHHQLLLSNFLNTTQTNIELSVDKSQFKFAKRQYQKQNNQLKQLQCNIVVDKDIQKSVKQLFLEYPISIESSIIGQNFIQSYQKHFKSLRQLLHLSLPIEKKEQDYLHSVVEVQIIQKLTGGKPIGQGGTSLIFPFKALVTFQNKQKVEKLIAIKKLRPEYQKSHKINHQKGVVSKLSNSICHFLPKYYSVQNNNQLGKCLLMDLIQGEDLDSYLAKHTYLSFWSKIYIILNVIQGVRHLINQGIVHLDMKPINILVCRQLITKIIDYGDSYHKDICPNNYVPGFTFPYSAPEVISCILQLNNTKNNELQYSQKQDAYAFGIILSQIFFNNRIFYLNYHTFKDVYAKGMQLSRFMECPERLSAYGVDIFMSTILLIIERCLNQPSRRPRFEWMNIILKLILNSFINTY